MFPETPERTRAEVVNVSSDDSPASVSGAPSIGMLSGTPSEWMGHYAAGGTGPSENKVHAEVHLPRSNPGFPLPIPVVGQPYSPSTEREPGLQQSMHGLNAFDNSGYRSVTNVPHFTAEISTASPNNRMEGSKKPRAIGGGYGSQNEGTGSGARIRVKVETDYAEIADGAGEQ